MSEQRAPRRVGAGEPGGDCVEKTPYLVMVTSACLKWLRPGALIGYHRPSCLTTC